MQCPQHPSVDRILAGEKVLPVNSFPFDPFDLIAEGLLYRFRLLGFTAEQRNQKSTAGKDFRPKGRIDHPCPQQLFIAGRSRTDQQLMQNLQFKLLPQKVRLRISRTLLETKVKLRQGDIHRQVGTRTECFSPFLIGRALDLDRFFIDQILFNDRNCLVGIKVAGNRQHHIAGIIKVL